MRQDEVLSDRLGGALERMRRRQPCEETDVPAGELADVQELERLGLLTRNQSMTATVRKIARTGMTPAKVVRQSWLTPQGERVLAEWRRSRGE